MHSVFSFSAFVTKHIIVHVFDVNRVVHLFQPSESGSLIAIVTVSVIQYFVFVSGLVGWTVH